MMNGTWGPILWLVINMNIITMLCHLSFQTRTVASSPRSILLCSITEDSSLYKSQPNKFISNSLISNSRYIFVYYHLYDYAHFGLFLQWFFIEFAFMILSNFWRWSFDFTIDLIVPFSDHWSAFQRKKIKKKNSSIVFDCCWVLLTLCDL